MMQPAAAHQSGEQRREGRAVVAGWGAHGRARLRRVAGWSLALSGVVYASLAAFAPIPVACRGGATAVLTGIALTFGYCLSLRHRAKAA
jgi:hypothetical protein